MFHEHVLGHMRHTLSSYGCSDCELLCRNSSSVNLHIQAEQKKGTHLRAQCVIIIPRPPDGYASFIRSVQVPSTAIRGILPTDQMAHLQAPSEELSHRVEIITLSLDEEGEEMALPTTPQEVAKLEKLIQVIQSPRRSNSPDEEKPSPGVLILFFLPNFPILLILLL